MQELKLNTEMKISLGNKSIGIASLVIAVLIALLFPILYFEYSTVIAAGLIIILSTFQISRVNYIRLEDNKVIIDNVIGRLRLKDIRLFQRVTRIGSGCFMKIEFSDGSYFFFYGDSDRKINKRISDYIEDHSQK